MSLFLFLLIYSKKESLFKFDFSLSAMTLNSTLKDNIMINTKQDKIYVCIPDPDNILYIFSQFMSFVDHIEELLGTPHGLVLFCSDYLH